MSEPFLYEPGLNNTATSYSIDLSHIQLVIFDCDGVLVDSEAICTEVLIDELAGCGVVVDKRFFNQHFLGRSYQHLVQTVDAFFKIQLPVDFEENYQQKLLKVFSHRLLPCAGIKSVLTQLAVDKCVATSSHSHRTKYVLNHLGLEEYFQPNIFTVSQVKRGKPAPDLFLHSAKQMRVNPKNCLVIEDSNAGLEAAQAAGMLNFHYVGGSHLQDLSEQDLNKYVKPTQRFKDWREFSTLAADLCHKKNSEEIQ